MRKSAMINECTYHKAIIRDNVFSIYLVSAFIIKFSQYRCTSAVHKYVACSRNIKEGGPFITRICNFIILSKYIHLRTSNLCKDKVVLKEASRPTVLLVVLSSITACLCTARV